MSCICPGNIFRQACQNLNVRPWLFHAEDRRSVIVSCTSLRYTLYSDLMLVSDEHTVGTWLTCYLFNPNISFILFSAFNTQNFVIYIILTLVMHLSLFWPMGGIGQIDYMGSLILFLPQGGYFDTFAPV